MRTSRSPPATATSMSIGMLGSDWLPYSIAFIAASLTAVFSRSSFAGCRPTPATASATRSIAWRSLPCSPGSVTWSRTARRRFGVGRGCPSTLAVGALRQAIPAVRWSETSVMSSSWSQPSPDEPLELVEEVVEELAAGPFRVHQLAQLWEAEHVACGVRAPRRGRRCRAGRSRPGRGPPRARRIPSRQEAQGMPVARSSITPSAVRT